MVAATFDVPGTVTLRDVSRPAAGETAQQRAYRLASKAVISGVRIFTERGSGRQFATSATDASTLYAVDVTACTCVCRGFEKYGICSHLALALAQAGMLELVTEPAACPACRSERGHKMNTGGRLSDWVWVTCRRCNGAGTVQQISSTGRNHPGRRPRQRERERWNPQSPRTLRTPPPSRPGSSMWPVCG